MGNVAISASKVVVWPQASQAWETFVTVAD
jgi:preprotein translocase subunit SecE